jgi:hypothetical protein
VPVLPEELEEEDVLPPPALEFFFPFCSAVCVNLNVVALWSAAEVEDQNANVLVLGLWSI